MEGVSLPVIRCLATTQLHLSAVLADMFTEHTEKQRMRSLKAREKPSVERVSWCTGVCVRACMYVCSTGKLNHVL